MKELLRLGPAADRLGVHVGTLRAWVRNGQIPAYRTGGRYARVAWDEVLSALRTSGPGDLETGGVGDALALEQRASAQEAANVL